MSAAHPTIDQAEAARAFGAYLGAISAGDSAGASQARHGLLKMGVVCYRPMPGAGSFDDASKRGKADACHVGLPRKSVPCPETSVDEL